MDEAKDSSSTTTHKKLHGRFGRFSRFLGCFGGVSENNKLPKKQETYKKSMAPESQRFSLSRMKKLGKMSPTRTVPFDAEKSHKKKENTLLIMRKSSKKQKQKQKQKQKHSFSDQFSGKEEEDGRIQAPEKVSHDKRIKWLGCVQTRRKNNEGIHIKEKESNKKKDPHQMTKNTLCKQETINFTMSSNATVITSHSISVSLQDDVHKHPVQTVNEVLQDNKVKSPNEKSNDGLVIGMLIMTIIYIIMIIWGKSYAILCTCALFYVHPFLRTKIEQNVVEQNTMSKDNKKVVLIK